MPQNHRTFLYLSVESIAHLAPSLSAVYPLYFSRFSLPRPMSAQSPSIPSFSRSFVGLRKSSHPSLLLLFTPSITIPPISISSVLFCYRHVSIFQTALAPSYPLFLRWLFFILSLSFTLTSCSLGSPHSCPLCFPWWALFHPARKAPGGHSCPCQGC